MCWLEGYKLDNHQLRLAKALATTSVGHHGSPCPTDSRLYWLHPLCLVWLWRLRPDEHIRISGIRTFPWGNADHELLLKFRVPYSTSAAWSFKFGFGGKYWWTLGWSVYLRWLLSFLPVSSVSSSRPAALLGLANCFPPTSSEIWFKWGEKIYLLGCFHQKSSLPRDPRTFCEPLRMHFPVISQGPPRGPSAPVNMSDFLEFPSGFPKVPNASLDKDDALDSTSKLPKTPLGSLSIQFQAAPWDGVMNALGQDHCRSKEYMSVEEQTSTGQNQASINQCYRSLYRNQIAVNQWARSSCGYVDALGVTYTVTLILYVGDVIRATEVDDIDDWRVVMLGSNDGDNHGMDVSGGHWRSDSQ